MSCDDYMLSSLEINSFARNHTNAKYTKNYANWKFQKLYLELFFVLQLLPEYRILYHAKLCYYQTSKFNNNKIIPFHKSLCFPVRHKVSKCISNCVKICIAEVGTLTRNCNIPVIYSNKLLIKNWAGTWRDSLTPFRDNKCMSW